MLGRYGPFGPPFADPELQATFLAEVKDLASSALITESTAKQLVATVMNTALAAGISATPAIRAEVQKVAQAAAAQGARDATIKVLLGGLLTGALTTIVIVGAVQTFKSAR